MDKRTAREISVPQELLDNKDIGIKIGTVENRNCPETVYIYISFWVHPKDDTIDSVLLRNKLRIFLGNIYNKEFIKSNITSNNFFTSERENIFIYNVPENFNYNNKPSFISLELYLHTTNLKEKKYPLNYKKDTDLFNECLGIANKIGKKIICLQKKYNIAETQKKLLD